MRSALLLLLVALGGGCGSNVNAAGVELVVAPGRRAPRLHAHPAIARTHAAARAVCGRDVPIRFELLGIRPESFAAERAVEELEGIASALELLASRSTSEPLREHVCETLAAIVVTHVFPPPRTREVHFGIEPSPHDSRERSPNDRGVLRVFWAPAPQPPARPTNGETDVLLELGRAHSIARARRFASVEPTAVPRDALASYAAYLHDVGSHGLWSLERRAPQRRRPPGWRRDLLLRALRARDAVADDATPLDDRIASARLELEHTIFALVDDREDVPSELTELVRAGWSSLAGSVRLRVLVHVVSTLPAADSTPRAPYGISLEDWVPLLSGGVHADPRTADEMLCASNEPTCERDRLARFVAHHPRIGPATVRGLAPSPTLLARFFGSAPVVPRLPSRPPLPWAALLRALDDDAQVVAARALAEASLTTGHAPHELEAGVEAIHPEATTEVRVELLRVLVAHVRPADGEPRSVHAEAAELALLLRRGGLDELARALHFAADDVDLIGIVGPELEVILRGQGDEEEAFAWLRVMNAAVRRFGPPGAKAFADFLRDRPHAAERRTLVQRWLATLSRV